MTLSHLSLIGLALASSALAEEPKVSLPGGYELVWHDEFEGAQLDSSKWGLPGYKKREAAAMNSPGTIVVKDGLLHLNALEKDGELHCAIIDTRGKFEQTYGWFEARMKMHRLEGIHSCFWLQTPTFQKVVDSPALSGTEMDIMEWFGPNRRSGWAGMNIYYWGTRGGKAATVRSSSIPHFHRMGGPVEDSPKSPLADMGSAFHVYALHWTKEACIFYCDGREIMRETTAISQVPEYLVLSLLCSDWERPKLDTKKLPDSFEVDYVRVYAMKDGATPPRPAAPAQP